MESPCKCKKAIEGSSSRRFHKSRAPEQTTSLSARFLNGDRPTGSLQVPCDIADFPTKTQRTTALSPQTTPNWAAISAQTETSRIRMDARLSRSRCSESSATGEGIGKLLRDQHQTGVPLEAYPQYRSKLDRSSWSVNLFSEQFGAPRASSRIKAPYKISL
jgi:hypothetical protein